MAQPRYFLKDVKPDGRGSIANGGNLDQSILRDMGLVETFSDVRLEDIARNPVLGNGPDGHSGTVITYQTPSGELPKIIGYDESLNWTQVHDQLWVGIDPSDPPHPQDLVRKKRFTGYNQDQFSCAIVRRPDGSTELPCSFRFYNVGNQEVVHDGYRALYDDLAQAVEWFQKNEFDNGKFDKWQAVELAVRVIGVNYRFSKIEQTLLDVVTTENFLLVLAHSIDFLNYCRANQITLAAS